MKFALLGDDPVAYPMLTAIAEDPAHDLTDASFAGQLTPKLMKELPATRLIDGWDELITDSGIDAVIVCGYDPHVLEGARQLAAAGKPLIVFPCAKQGTTWFYELGLVRDDTHIPLIPIFVARFDPRHKQLKEYVGQSLDAKVLQLKIDRFAPVAAESNRAALLSSDVTDEVFFQDVDLLRWLGGDYSRVTCFQSGVAGERFSQLINTLSGDGLPESLWSIQAAPDSLRWILTVTTETPPPLVLTGTDDESKWQSSRGCVASGGESNGSSPYRQLDHCVQALEGKEFSPDWSDVTRASEICDGAKRSLKRRRTIDLHFESTSERSQFKTHMTAIGCSLLSLTLLGVVFVLIAGTLLDPRETAEIKADRARAIFYVDDFAPSSAEFAAPVDERMKELAVRMRGASFPVLVEIDPALSTTTLDDERRKAVVEQLKQAGANDAELRTESAGLKGRGFQTIMLIARLLVFIPLGLFLLLQCLLFVARPSSNAPKAGPAPDSGPPNSQ